jgi:hypothetical protein
MVSIDRKTCANKGQARPTIIQDQGPELIAKTFLQIQGQLNLPSNIKQSRV